MDKIELQREGDAFLLVLRDEVTVEDTPRLKDALIEAIGKERGITVCAAELTRLDAAGVQLLIAGARAAPRAVIRDVVPTAWVAAFARYAVEDPFIHESPC